MNNKIKSLTSQWALLIALVIIGVVLLFTFTKIDRYNLTTSLDETITFAKHRLDKYQTFKSNDQVKSLVRLLDKSNELSDNIDEWSGPDEAKIKDYALRQRLDGVILLDENLNVTMDTTDDGTGYELWSDMISCSYVSDIITYPQKTYTTRTTIDGSTYDFAAVSRKDESGLIITYLKKDNYKEAYGDITLDTLFSNFPFEMNGTLVVCEDDMVVSSSDTSLVGKTVDECKEMYNGSFKASFDGIVRLVSNNGIWYGRRDSTTNYTIYMFFPSYQVFMKRNVVCGVYLLVALLILTIYILGRNKAEKKTLAREQKRLRTINAIGYAYTWVTLYDMKNGTVERLKGKEDFAGLVAEPFMKDYSEFADMNTVADRLEGLQSLSITSQTTDGRWMLSLIIPQRFNADGKIDAVLLATRNITAQKQHEIEQDNALRNALANAEHANKTKTVFLNNMSHDIRTPMNAIIGFTALAVSHIDEREHVIEYLRKINIAGKHLLSLINDVLDMSRIENGSVKIEENEVHLPDVLHDLRAIIQGNIGAKQQDLYIDTQDVVHEDILTDKLRLNQVLLNIISNAVKFTSVGGMINVRVTEKPSEKIGYATYEFCIKDNGIGIDKEFQEHIFDSFARERTVTESGIQGTGLGLAIAKNIIDMMNGTITLNSEKGKGSEFIVTLDCKISDCSVKYEPIPELVGSRALVVDDDANTCMSISKMLRKIEMQADWTTTGKEAVMRAKEAFDEKRAFAVYIIDWMMPDMNGVETVRRIRRVIGNETPIIILTAYDWTDIEYEAREAGVTAFIAKPLFMSELHSVLSQPVSKRVKNVNDDTNNDQSAWKKRHEGKKIMLVEDNELNQEIAVAIIEEAGLIVDTVNDGSEAVERMASATEDRYDLILMDIQMPKMDGYTATRQIRTLSNNKKANIPILAMTANAFEEDRKKAFEAGMNGHIAKPISIDVILEAMDEILF